MSDGEGVMSNDERLVYMANQIARNFQALDHDAAAAATADHIRHFWDPRMKTRIRELVAADPESLGAIATAALAILATSAPAPQTRATEFSASAAGMSDAG